MPILRPRIVLAEDSDIFFEFISIEPRNRTTVGTVVRPLMRPGSDETAFRQEGMAARPFIARCQRDAANLYQAEQWLAFMTQLLKGQACEMRLLGGWVEKHLVCLEISTPVVRPIIRGVGGFLADPKALFTVDVVLQQYKQADV